MPGGNRRGPAGAGPLSGRGAGYCGGRENPGRAQDGPSGRRRGGRGNGAGRRAGGGRGWRHRFLATGLPGWAREEDPYGTASERAERGRLAVLAERLAAELEAVRTRLAGLPPDDAAAGAAAGSGR